MSTYFINSTCLAALGASKETATALVCQEKKPKIEKPDFFFPSSSSRRFELQHFYEVLLAGFLFKVYTMFLVLNPTMLNRAGKPTLVFENSCH